MAKSAKATKASEVTTFTSMPNIGRKMAEDFALLGFSRPSELAGQDPYALYDRMCELTRTRQDPCVADVYIAAVRFMEGSPPYPWWHYTDERKRAFAARGIK